MLYRLRRPATRPPPTVLSILSAVGILHYRGCRGGRKLQRVIRVVTGRGRMYASDEGMHSRSSLTLQPRVRCLVVVSCTAPQQALDSLMPTTAWPATAGFDAPPYTTGSQSYKPRQTTCTTVSTRRHVVKWGGDSVNLRDVV